MKKVQFYAFYVILAIFVRQKVTWLLNYSFRPLKKNWLGDTGRDLVPKTGLVSDPKEPIINPKKVPT